MSALAGAEGHAAAQAAAAADDQGLVCAFRLGPVEPVGAEALRAGVPASEGRPLWIHLNMADARARRWLEQEAGLAPAVVRALLEPEPRIHVAGAGGGVVAVLGDLHHDFGRDPEGLGTVRVYVEGARVITVRRHRLRTPDRVRRELLEQRPAIATTAALFEHFVLRLSDTYADVITKLVDEVDGAEDEILAGRYQTQGLVLGRVRRMLARLRRHVAANRGALAGLRHHAPPGWEGDRPSAQPLFERFDSAVQDLDGLQERTRLLQEEIAGRLAEATNRNLFVLSTITVALLPITLITGIFGMNVGGLPWLSDPHGFRWVMACMFVGVGAALLFLFRRRMM